MVSQSAVHHDPEQSGLWPVLDPFTFHLKRVLVIQSLGRSCEVDERCLLRGECRSARGFPCFYPVYDVVLQRLDIVPRTRSCHPGVEVVYKSDRALALCDGRVYQVGVEEQEEDG